MISVVEHAPSLLNFFSILRFGRQINANVYREDTIMNALFITDSHRWRPGTATLQFLQTTGTKRKMDMTLMA